MMLTCYLDESGTHDESSMVTLAGYAAIDPAWKEFETRGRAIYEQYGIVLLHAVDFHNTRGEFCNWSRLKKESFVREMQACIRPSVEFGVMCSVPKEEFRRARLAHDVAHQESAYGYAFRMVLHNVFQDPVVERALAQAGGYSLSVVLESGAPNSADVQRIFSEVKAAPRYASRLDTLTLADKRSSIALQVSDFLAYYSRRYVAAYDERQGYAPEPEIIAILRSGVAMHDHVAVAFDVV